MALQHFYSSVPAKLSVFNHADGYDTFAYSKGLEKGFITGEMPVIYDNKPAKSDADMIRRGEMLPVYSQYISADGTVVQSCVSFQPTDYTGEKSAYLVHSLILTEKEKAQLFNSRSNYLFNSDMFVKGVEGFDFSSNNASPNVDYPSKDYEVISGDDLKEFAESFDSAMMRRLIFIILNIFCGKCKGVYIALPSEMDQFSEDALAFINCIFQIFPYCLRQKFSFVTYVGDFSKYNSLKIKFIPETAPDVPVSKGASVRFSTKITVGVQENAYNANKPLVNFFYSLFTNDEIRYAMLDYFDYAVKQMPDLKNMNLKSITDLVFLFQVGSGFYEEKSILPKDDRVYEFFTAYEKFGSAMPENYRSRAVKCLQRYPNDALPIPKNVFSRISHIYAEEPANAKRIIMDSVLELSHTDAMRDKLFAFIRANYQNETPDYKVTICDHVCRVYYGGFLQSQIIEFFNEIFADSSAEIADSIVDKLILTIRTDDIQEKIVDFFKNNYSHLSEEQKDGYYETFFEMLPECDLLSERMINAVNEQIKLDEGLSDEVAECLCETVLESDKEQRADLISLLIRCGGFCGDTIAQKIVTEWVDKDIFTDYITVISCRPYCDALEQSIDLMKSSKLPRESVDHMVKTLAGKLEASHDSYDITRLLEADNIAVNELDEYEGKNISEQAIRPAIRRSLYLVFSIKYNGPDIAKEYAEKTEYLLSCEEYEPVKNYFKLIDLIESGDCVSAIKLSEKLNDKQISKGVGDCLKNYISKSESLIAAGNETVYMVALALVEMFKGGNISFSEPYKNVQDRVSKRFAASPECSSDAEMLAYATDNTSMLCFYKAVDLVYNAGNEKLVQTVSAANGEVFQLTNSFVAKYGKKAKRYVTEFIHNEKCNQKFTDQMNAVIKRISDDQPGFFSNISLPKLPKLPKFNIFNKK